MKILANIYSIIHEYAIYEAAVFAFLLLIVLLFFYWQIQRLRLVRELGDRANLLLEHLNAAQGIEKNINYLLELVGTLIDAPVYAFYIFDKKNRQYFLKGVRHSQTDFGKVRPSYSGLVSYKKEAYMPPISLYDHTIPIKAELQNEGEVPLFIIPLGGIGAIRIGPIAKVSNKLKRVFDEFSMQIQFVLPELILAESIRNQVEVVVASGKALQNISDVAIDPKVTFEILIGASIRAVNAIGGFYAELIQDSWQLPTIVGIGSDVKKDLEEDKQILQLLFDKAKANEYIVLKQGEPDFYKLPPSIAAQGTEAIVVARLGIHRFLVFLFNKITDKEMDDNRQISMIAADLKQILDSQAPLQHLSKVYINILKKLARMMDNLNPYTIGYSDQMSRYAIIIAKEMKLSEAEIRDIALSAFLSNIGVLGLSSELYQKEGKYTEAEYEMMKLHSEVGSSVISVTTGNKRVASYILYHHERIDGAGYPAGLRGSEIPIGARIIAVVQTFLAKINGRKERDPLPFDKALQMLVSASGTQLDKQVVDALLQWYRNKQMDPLLIDHALGNCWDICCTPSSICEHCPVYQQSSSEPINCWEVEGNLCSAHGKKCSACFVQTEFLTRSVVKKRA
jgi:HD-GYP domain-containing protein (c-di-GMP phosphodiesterase class II)